MVEWERDEKEGQGEIKSKNIDHTCLFACIWNGSYDDDDDDALAWLQPDMYVGYPLVCVCALLCRSV